MDLNEKKKLLYRSTHRGCKEMDILLGNFAKEYLFSLSDDELKQYKRIVDMDDELIYKYFKMDDMVPEDIFLLKKIINLSIC